MHEMTFKLAVHRLRRCTYLIHCLVLEGHHAYRHKRNVRTISPCCWLLSLVAATLLMLIMSWKALLLSSLADDKVAQIQAALSWTDKTCHFLSTRSDQGGASS